MLKSKQKLSLVFLIDGEAGFSCEFIKAFEDFRVCLNEWSDVTNELNVSPEVSSSE